jgi:cysteine synthase A
VACEPDNSPLLGSGVTQPRDARGEPAGSHPLFRPHLMQGWSPDFVARLTQQAVDETLVDEIIGIDGAAALQAARDLARQEGILAGISAGATLVGALEVCRREGAGTRVLCMLPDTGERYLSTPLFEDVAADMNDAELEIARSTPNQRFDAPPSAVVTPLRQAAQPAALNPAAVARVDALIDDPHQPVVMFALAWCEFCWSVRKLFDRLGVPYRAVDLDAPAYQAGDEGGRIRAVLEARTGQRTIPQVFVGRRHVGGCSEVFDAYRSGELTRRLADCGLDCAAVEGLDPMALLPAWLHAR